MSLRTSPCALILSRQKIYRHLEGSTQAHNKVAIIGDSRTLMIEEGKLLLGTWHFLL